MTSTCFCYVSDLSREERRACIMIKDDSFIVSYIYRAYITLKDGTRIYARQYGKKAFRIPVYACKHE